jgi:hypothetical protein
MAEGLFDSLWKVSRSTGRYHATSNPLSCYSPSRLYDMLACFLLVLRLQSFCGNATGG